MFFVPLNFEKKGREIGRSGKLREREGENERGRSCLSLRGPFGAKVLDTSTFLSLPLSFSLSSFSLPLLYISQLFFLSSKKE
jgi:hypothetical protein